MFMICISSHINSTSLFICWLFFFHSFVHFSLFIALKNAKFLCCKKIFIRLLFLLYSCVFFFLYNILFLPSHLLILVLFIFLCFPTYQINIIHFIIKYLSALPAIFIVLRSVLSAINIAIPSQLLFECYILLHVLLFFWKCFLLENI